MNEYLNKENLIKRVFESMNNNYHKDPKIRLNHKIEHEHFLDIIYQQENVFSKWNWYEDWTPSTPDGPAECQDAGWYCSNCNWSPNKELGIEFESSDDIPKFNFCPNCGLPTKNRKDNKFTKKETEIKFKIKILEE